MYPYVKILGKNIQTYGLLLCVGAAVVFVLAYRYGKKFKICLDDFFIVGAFSLGLGLTGASLLYAAVTYSFEEIISALLSLDFSVFGGLVFFGGFIGGLIGAIMGCRTAKIKICCVEDSLIPYFPIGHAIGRIGCLMAGCCRGIEYDGFLAVHYKNSVAGVSFDRGFFPIQLLEALLNIGIIFLVVAKVKKVKTALI